MQLQRKPGEGEEGHAERGVPCQLEAFPGELERGPPGRDEPWSWYLRRRARGARRKVAAWLRRLGGRGRAPVEIQPFPPTTLVAGDLVRVRPAEYIRRTLDGQGGIKGCGFGLGMYQYCGRELRVIRVVHQFFDEKRFRLLRARDMVLLEGVYCDGSNLPDTAGCDRMCFYFWRTEWLERVESADAKGSR